MDIQRLAQGFTDTFIPQTTEMARKMMTGEIPPPDIKKNPSDIFLPAYIARNIINIAPAAAEIGAYSIPSMGLSTKLGGAVGGAGRALSTILRNNSGKITPKDALAILGQGALGAATAGLMSKFRGPGPEIPEQGPDLIQSQTRNFFTGGVQALGDRSGNLPATPIPNVTAPLQAIAERIVKNGTPTNATTQMLNLVTPR